MNKMINEDKSMEYADKRLDRRDPELARCGYSRRTKMKVTLFDGSDIEDAFLDGAEWKENEISEKLINWIDKDEIKGLWIQCDQNDVDWEDELKKLIIEQMNKKINDEKQRLIEEMNKKINDEKQRY